LAFVHSHVQAYGPVFKASLMGVRGAVVLTSWAAITKVMMGEGKGAGGGPDGADPVSRWWMPPAFQELLGSASDPAVQTDRARHAKRRRQQGTAFTPAAMASYAPRVEATARASLARWAAAPGPVDLVSELSTTTFGFAETVVDLGLEGPARAALLDNWSTYVRNLMALPIDLPGTRLHAAKAAKRKILTAIDAAVARYLAAFTAGERPPTSMLGFYMAARAADGDPLAAGELGDMVLALLLAGHDTSHAGHTVLLATLPRLPADLKARLAEEQRGVVARHGDALSQAALGEMPLGEAVIKECLRLLGPADGLWREAASDFVVDGVRVPAGTKLFCSVLYAKATDPAIIGPAGLAPDAALPPPHMDINSLSPAAFDPDRWLGGAGGEPTGGVGTFGMGPRFCLGAPLFYQEAKCLLAVAVREYDLELTAPAAWAPSWAAQVVKKAEIGLGVTKKGAGAAIVAANVGKAAGGVGAAAGVPPPPGAVESGVAGAV
jgi:cytochrome P450